MKTLCVTIALICAVGFGYAQKKQTESPYFILKNKNQQQQFALQSTKVNTNISGVIADVNLLQSYQNNSDSVIEATYVFPTSTNAAIYSMQMIIGERVINAEIKEKNKAQKSYDKAKKQGKKASLLVQQRPNVFTMHVANIQPNETIKVLVNYTEVIVPENGIYSFVFPTIVGPRYVEEKKEEDWSSNPHLTEIKTMLSELYIDVNINSALPIQSLKCETHDVDIDFTTKTNAKAKLINHTQNKKDFILKYQLAGNQIETGVLTYDDENGDHYFLAMIEPPKPTKIITTPKKEYVFIIDVSGSMNGFPLDVSKELIYHLLHQLKPTDLFNIVFFAGGSNVYAEQSLPVTQENIQQAINYLDNHSGTGGTELLNAVETAMNLNAKPNYARTFVIATDGYVTVEKETFNYIRNHLNTANFFAFGIGSSVNRHIIEGIAHAGYGEPYIATTKKEATTVAKQFIKDISNPILTNIEYEIDGIELKNCLPGKIHDLFSSKPIIICGKSNEKISGTLTIKGYNGIENITIKNQLNSSTKSTKAIKYFWARQKIKLLSDYENLDGYYNSDSKRKLKNEITSLGLKYHLSTKYTSFIAIDDKPIEDFPTTLEVVADDEDLEEIEISFLDEVNASTLPPSPISPEELVVDDAIYEVVEKQAGYPGGFGELMTFIATNMKYPEEAKENQIQGKVYVSFVIDKQGNVKDVKIIKSPSELLSKEAIRIVKSMKSWIPAYQKGKPVNSRFKLPISFRIAT